MMSKRERAVVEQLIRACELCALGVTGHRREAEDAAMEGKKLLPPEPTLRWIRDGRGLWTAHDANGDYAIMRPDCRGPFSISRRGVPSGSLPTLQQAKRYCEQKARS